MTKRGGATELVEAGIPRESIVLGFRDPELRKYTGFRRGLSPRETSRRRRGAWTMRGSLAKATGRELRGRGRGRSARAPIWLGIQRAKQWV